MSDTPIHVYEDLDAQNDEHAQLRISCWAGRLTDDATGRDKLRMYEDTVKRQADEKYLAEGGDNEAIARRDIMLSRTAKPDGTVVETPRNELANWWRGEAEDEIGMVVDKAIEYGSTDLEDIGHQIARIAGRTVSDTEATEIGIYFYIEGKVARFRSAVMEGRPVSADTLKDIGIYVRMASRNQQRGGWPGTKENLS